MLIRLQHLILFFLNNGDSRVIWLGDLNYRIALSYTDARKLLEGNDWDALLGKDQVISFVGHNFNNLCILFFLSVVMDIRL